MAANRQTMVYLGGDVFYNRVQEGSSYLDGVSLTQDEVKKVVCDNSENRRISRVQVLACYDNGIKFFYSMPDFHLVLLKTDDGYWWAFNSDCWKKPGHLQISRVSEYDPDSNSRHSQIIFGTWSTTVRDDDSSISVEQLFKFIDETFILTIQFESSPGDTVLFSKEMFDRIAHTQSFESFQTLLREVPNSSPGFGSTGTDWKGLVRFIDLVGPSGKQDFNKELLSTLQDEIDPQGTDIITHVYAFKVPLDERCLTNMVFFHSYITFRSVNSAEQETWWSIEKNRSFIVLQNGRTHEKVRDKVSDEKRCESWFYWKPQLLGKDVCANRSLLSLVELLKINDELGIHYQGPTENCQKFAKVMFDWMAVSQKLNFGWLASLPNFILQRRDYRTVTDRD